jgi:glycosyltransferase involved in cell wall biosynthesis
MTPASEVVDGKRRPRRQIVFCVENNDLASGGVDARAAVGLGHALADQGHGVTIVNRERWHRLPDAYVVISLSPAFDPTSVSGRIPVVAWICGEVSAWSKPRLSLFDAVLASSQAGADRLAEACHSPVGVLPIGVDCCLFRPPPVRNRSDVVALEKVEGPSYFTLPDLYRHALVVIDNAASTQLPFGTRISRVLEVLACGAIPVTTHGHELGLAEIGLADVPVCKTALQIDRVVRELRADPAATMAVGARLGTLVRAEHAWERRVSAFLTHVEPLVTRFAESHSAACPATLGFFPDYRKGNPYQAMLYADLPAHDVVVTPVAAPDVIVPRDPGGRLDHYALHLHWTSPVLQSQPGPFGAELALRRFRQRIRKFRDRGGRLVWTIHNALPHESPNGLAEIQLCRFLATQADVIHVMGASTARIVAPLYELATERTAVIPHSSYLGVYPDVVSRSDARHRLQLREHEIVLLMLGAIRPYKGLSLLLDVFDELCRSDPRFRLLVVGQPSHEPESARWKDRCEHHPRIVASFGRAADEDLQIWCRAADLAVLPYVSVLNSGWFQLAISFDLPVVGARDGVLADLLDPAYSEGFAPGSAADFRRVLEVAARRLVGRLEVRRAVHAAARRYPPKAMAHDFAAAVLPLFPRLRPSIGVPEAADSTVSIARYPSSP